MSENLKKYDVALVDFNPRKGHAQSGVRPAVLIQSNLFNKNSSTLIFVPLTSAKKELFPSEFWIQATKINGLKHSSRFLGSQLMTVDKSWVLKKMGYLEEGYHSLIQQALALSLDWEDDF